MINSMSIPLESRVMVENFLTQDEVNSILTEFMSVDRINEDKNDYLAEDGKSSLTEAFYNLSTTLKFVPKFEDYLKPIYGNNLTFSNTYTRLYKNDSFLRTHTDRPGLDVTVSLGLRRDVPWAIHVSTRELSDDWSNAKTYDKSAWMKFYLSYDLHPGDFAHCYGRKNPHWRETLRCAENQCNIYSFFHWSMT